MCCKETLKESIKSIIAERSNDYQSQSIDIIVPLITEELSCQLNSSEISHEAFADLFIEAVNEMPNVDFDRASNSIKLNENGEKQLLSEALKHVFMSCTKK